MLVQYLIAQADRLALHCDLPRMQQADCALVPWSPSQSNGRCIRFP